MSSLPLPGPVLTLGLLPQAAARQGFLCDLRRVRLSAIPTASLPVILVLKDGMTIVLTENSDRGTPVVWDPRQQAHLTWTRKELRKRFAGLAAFITVSRADETPNSHRTSMNFARTLFSGWSTWIQILLTAFFVNLLGLAVPLFTMNVYDRVIPNMSFPTLWALAIGVMLALVMDAVLRQLRAVLLDSTGRRIDLRVSSEIFEHAIALSLGAKRASSGVIASQIREFDAVREFFTSASIIALTDLLFIGISLWVLWLIAGDIAFVPLVAVPIVIVVTLLLQVPLARTTRSLQQYASRRQAVLIESLAALEAIKSSNAEGHVQRKWEEALAGAARANSSVRRWSSFALYFTSIVQQAVTILITVWGVTLIYEGRLTIGALIAANILASRILSPLGNIAMTLARGQQAITALVGINALMQLPRDRPPKLGGSPRVFSPEIEFRKVTFNYPGQELPALNKLTCKIRKGERVGIVGKVGSGKTTMGRLMAGLYMPSEGAVLISEADTRSYDPAELRAGVGFVAQDPELFTGTLRENITLGLHAASDQVIAAVLSEVGLTDLVKSHPAGLQMEVGERGRNLSGGQRQAVALARILIRNPKILFLDEPSSALDSQSEQALIRALLRWSEGENRTLVVCSHRLGMLNLASRLLVINEGQVTADGPRDEIIAKLGAATKAAAG